MGFFEEYDKTHRVEQYGETKTVTAAEAVDRPFILKNLRIKENYRGKFGIKDLVIAEVRFLDDEESEIPTVLMLQQAVLVSKMKYIFAEGWPKDLPFVILKTTTTDGKAAYYDLQDNPED